MKAKYGADHLNVKKVSSYLYTLWKEWSLGSKVDAIGKVWTHEVNLLSSVWRVESYNNLNNA